MRGPYYASWAMNVSIYRSLRSLNLFACLLLSGLTLALPSLAQVKPIASPQKESTAIANFVDVAAKSGLTMMNVFGGTDTKTVSYTHLRAHETPEHLVCRLLLGKK